MKCKGIRQDGKRCQTAAKNGTDRCRHHAKADMRAARKAPLEPTVRIAAEGEAVIELGEAIQKLVDARIRRTLRELVAR